MNYIQKTIIFLMGNNDLTKGNELKSILLFSIPMIIGNLLQQAYNITDSLIVGNKIGPDALAAVGSAFTLMTFLTSILIGLGMGSGVVISTYFGMKDDEGMEKSISTSFIIYLIISAVIMGITLPFVSKISNFLNIPQNLKESFEKYVGIVLLGIPAIALYNYFSSFLKSMGDSLSPLIFLAVSTFINIVLDFVFVLILHWDIEGVAYATIIAEYISALLILVYTYFSNSYMKSSFKNFCVSKKSLNEISRFSLLTCIQQSVMNLGILLVQGIINSFGSIIMAAFSAAMKIDAFAYMPLQEFGNSFSTFLAQNNGAGKTKRLEKGLSCLLL